MALEYALQVSGDYDKLLDAARFAKERGLVALALPDHYLMALTEEEAGKASAPDALIQLGGLARETDGIDLVVLVAPITFRHPAVLAKTGATLDLMSGGRFTLGVGTGWMDLEHEVFGIPYPERKERFEMLEEALAYLYAAFDPDHPGYDGERYQLRDFPIAPMPERRVPLLVGGVGEHKTPRLAGTYANEFNVYPGPNLKERIQRCRDAAAAAGRDPDSILISSAGQVIAKDTEEEFDDYLNEVAEERGMTRDELDEYFAARRPPQGTFEQVRAVLDEMEAAGVQRFYFQGIYSDTDTGALLDGLGV